MTLDGMIAQRDALLAARSGRVGPMGVTIFKKNQKYCYAFAFTSVVNPR